MLSVELITWVSKFLNPAVWNPVKSRKSLYGIVTLNVVTDNGLNKIIDGEGYLVNFISTDPRRLTLSGAVDEYRVLKATQYLKFVLVNAVTFFIIKLGNTYSYEIVVLTDGKLWFMDYIINCVDPT